MTDLMTPVRRKRVQREERVLNAIAHHDGLLADLVEALHLLDTGVTAPKSVEALRRQVKDLLSERGVLADCIEASGFDESELPDRVLEQLFSVSVFVRSDGGRAVKQNLDGAQRLIRSGRGHLFVPR